MSQNNQRPIIEEDEKLNQNLIDSDYSKQDRLSFNNINNNQDSNNSNAKSRNRRKYNFQRASIACEQCRKAKTRCNYINNGTNCFRCENLSLKCSLSDIKLKPTLSTFQKSANLTTRDEIDEIKALKKRKKNNSTNNNKIININNEIDSNNDSNIYQQNLKNEITNFSTTDSNENPNANLLLLLNDKIDKLNSSVKFLIDQKDSLLSNNVRNITTSLNSIPTIQNNKLHSNYQELPSNNQQNNHLFSTTLPSFNKLSSTSSTTTQSEKNSNSIIPSFLYPIRPNFSSNPNFIPSTSNYTLLQSVQRPVTAPLARPYFQTTNFVSPNANPPLVSTNIINTNNSNSNNNSGINKDSNLKDINSQSNNKITKINNNNNNSSVSLNSNNSTMVHENDEFFFLNAPYLDLSNIACNLGLPFTKEIGFDITRDTTLISIQERYDLINRKLLDYETCYKLIEIALFHYSKWITYVETDFKIWFDSIRITSPLLFCTLVLLGLRHNRIDNIDKNLDLDILQSIHQLLSLTVYEIPQSKEFLQVSILLALFSPSLSFKHIYFDSWWISSYGLIHFMTREMNMNLLVKSVKSSEKIHQYRIWNHLTFAHLINCILSGRPCIIDEIRLDQCRDILVLPEANSFDAVMVANISIILSMYNSLQFPENLEISLKELDSTYSDWKYLTDNLSSGSVVTGFYLFGKSMILRRYLFKNISNKNQSHYVQKGTDFLNIVVSLVELGKSNDNLLNSTDLLKQCFFLAIFMLLQFKQMDIIKESNDHIILDCITKSLDVLELAEKRNYYFNDYVYNYTQLIRRFKDLLFNQ